MSNSPPSTRALFNAQPDNSLFAAARGERLGLRSNTNRLSFIAAAEIVGFHRLGRSLGYSVVNRLIDTVCARIQAGFPACEVGRAGRACIDFAFEARSRDEAKVKLVALAASAAHDVVLDGFKLDLPITIGVASADGRGAGKSLELAEGALAEARRRKIGVAFAEDCKAMAEVEGLSLARDLQQSIGSSDISLVYQPKLHARSSLVPAAEALVRWTHPSRGAVSPDVFVPLAEETGMIRRLTEWILTRALEDQSRLVAAGSDVAIHVNLSGELLADLDFTAWVLSAVGTRGNGLGFEITETAMIGDPEGALRNLQLYADAGIHLSIDDYGSGYSSLAYLQRLPVNEIKIDQSFVRGLTSSHRDPLLVRSTIDLAHALEMDVTAEGVETPDVLALLQIMGCDLIQGYFVSKPLPISDLEAFCNSNRHGWVSETRLAVPRFRSRMQS